MNDESMIRRLERPKKRIDIVLDTDAYNEIDDQFAIAYMLKQPEKFNIKAIYAAPFHNSRSDSPADGMKKSYNEIITLLKLAEMPGLIPQVFKGSENYLPSESEAVISDASRHLAELADGYTPENPLYVAAIGAITNVASAIILNPSIKDKIVVSALCGHALHWGDTKEFNMYQDIAAARVVFGCGAPLIQLPCMGVVSSFTTTGPELEYWLRGKSKLCDYLVDSVVSECESYAHGAAWSRVIWDVTAVAWLCDSDSRMVYDRLERAPISGYDGMYENRRAEHDIKYVYHIGRDALMTDLFRKITR